MLSRRTIRRPRTGSFQTAVLTVWPRHATSRGRPTLTESNRATDCVLRAGPLARIPRQLYARALVNGPHVFHQEPQAFRQSGMDIDGSLQERVGQITQHEGVEGMDNFAPLYSENGCAQYPVIRRVHYNLHEPRGLVTLERPSDHRHRDLADFELVPLSSGLLFRHADSTKLRIGEDAVRHEAVIDREVLSLDQVRVDDLEVVVGNVGKGRSPLYIAQRPDAVHIRFEAAVHLYESELVGFHSRLLEV